MRNTSLLPLPLAQPVAALVLSSVPECSVTQAQALRPARLSSLPCHYHPCQSGHPELFPKQNASAVIGTSFSALLSKISAILKGCTFSLPPPQDSTLFSEGLAVLSHTALALGHSHMYLPVLTAFYTA